MKERPDRGATDRGEARRANLVEAATELFLEHGFEGTTLEMLVARIGGSRREIYRFFGGKEGLFEAVVESVCDRILRLLERPDLEEQEPAQALATIGRVYLDMLLEPRTMGLYRLVLSEARRSQKMAKLFLSSGPSVAYRRLAALLEREHGRGRVVVEDPELAATQFVGLLTARLHMRAALDPGYRPSRAERDRNVAEAVETFVARFVPAGPAGRETPGKKHHHKAKRKRPSTS